MNAKLLISGVACIVFSLCFEPRSSAQGTAFSYQGVLATGGSPVTGTFEMRFGLYGSSTGGTCVGNLITNFSVFAANGQFATTLDFGNVFNGQPLWLEIGVRPTAIQGDFTTLTPRQPIASMPYAVTASNITGTLQASQLTGTLPPSTFPTTLPPLNGINLTNLAVAGTMTASATNQGAITPTGYAALNMSQGAQLTATPFKTPPMGWMSWNCCGGGGATESSVLGMATNMVNCGLPALGYNLVQIDAGWAGYRDTNGFIHESTNRFPDGMGKTVGILHSMGLKVGIYTGINLTNPIAYFVGDDEAALFNTNFSNEQELMNDAQTYVNWGIDYVKLEGGVTSISTEDQEQRWYETFAAAAQNAGKPLYIMAAVDHECSPWMYGVINARRCGCWDMGNYQGTPGLTFYRYMGNFWIAAAHPEYSAPGCFVSLDAIPAGDPACPTYMLMTAMMNGELIWNWFYPNGSGFSDAAYMTNIIQIDQDPAALMARCVLTNGTVTVWKKPLGGPASTTFALAFFNTDTSTNAPVSTTISLQSLGVTSPQLTCLDLISNLTTTIGNGPMSATVPPMTAYGFKLSPYTPPASTTTGTNYAASITDRTIFVSASGQTITLPTAIGNSGLSLTVKLTVAGNCTVATTGSQLIDGATSYALSAQYKSVTVQSDGTQWWVLSSN